MDFFKAPQDQRWITVYMTFTTTGKTKSKLFKEITSFVEQVGWKLFVNRDLVESVRAKKAKQEVHIAARPNALITPRELIKTHYKLIQFMNKISKLQKKPKPTYITELTVRGRHPYIVHKYGDVYIIYKLKDRKRLEQDPAFASISTKMFVEPIEELERRILHWMKHR